MANTTTLAPNFVTYTIYGLSAVVMNTTEDSDPSSLEQIENPQLAEFAERFLTPAGIISVIVALFGIVFNILNIIVLMDPKMRTPVNFLLTMMGSFELMLLIIYVPFVSIFNIGSKIDGLPRFHTANKHSAAFLLFYLNASVFLHLSVSWLLITTACFRFICVQFPVKSVKLCSYRRAVIAACSAVSACLIISIPNLMLNTITKIPCKSAIYNNGTLCYISDSFYDVHPNIKKYGNIFTDFNFWLFAVFGKFIPATLLLTFTIFLMKVLMDANERKKRLRCDPSGQHRHTHTSEHSQTLRMLLAVVFLFCLIEFPHGVFLVWVVIMKAYGIYQLMGDVIELATVTAFSLNLILYSAMSRQYRQLFIEIFTIKLKSKLTFKAQYKKCSNRSSRNGATPRLDETCALTVGPDTLHSVLPSYDSEEQNILEKNQKIFLNSH